MSQQQTYHVRGMTCGHCARAVISELEALATVTAVTVDVVPEGDSTVIVASSVELAQDAVIGAIGRAGYQFVGKA